MGGEIEPGESKEETIKRELVEEVGFAGRSPVIWGRRLIIFTRDIEKRITIIRLILFDDRLAKIGEPTEQHNQLSWHTPEEAIHLLKRGSHAWAVKQWVNQKTTIMHKGSDRCLYSFILVHLTHSH